MKSRRYNGHRLNTIIKSARVRPGARSRSRGRVRRAGGVAGRHVESVLFDGVGAGLVQDADDGRVQTGAGEAGEEEWMD